MAATNDTPWLLEFVVSLPIPAKVILTIALLSIFALLLWFIWMPHSPMASETTAGAHRRVDGVAQQAMTPRLPKPSDSIVWDDHWGTTTKRENGTVYLSALQIRGRNMSKVPIILQDAFVISGKTGHTVKMQVDAGEEGWIPIGKLNPIPPNAIITLVVQFEPRDGLPARDFMLDWGILTFTAQYENRQHVRTFDENELAKIFEGFGINPLGPRVSKKSD